MNKKDIAAFYVGAALFLNFDSDAIDDILAEDDMSVEENTAQECVEVFQKRFPNQYWRERITRKKGGKL